MAQERTVFHVVPFSLAAQGVKAWAVTVKDTVIKVSTNKEACRQWVTQTCVVMRRYKLPSQVVVHGRDGKIQTEHTYLDDPKESKG